MIKSWTWTRKIRFCLWVSTQFDLDYWWYFPNCVGLKGLKSCFIDVQITTWTFFNQRLWLLIQDPNTSICAVTTHRRKLNGRGDEVITSPTMTHTPHFKLLVRPGNVYCDMLFSCPGQLNRWPCQSVSEWVSESDFWFQRQWQWQWQ